ncbi:helix-turn-helix transcriptional regulator [Actinomycetaceae bacterium L2_0104]
MTRNPEPERNPSAISGRPEPLWRHMVGEEFRRLRRERGETLGETARRAGVSPQYLSEMERGVKDPSSEMIAAVARALGIGLIDLTGAVTRNLQPAGPSANAGRTHLRCVSGSRYGAPVHVPGARATHEINPRVSLVA